MSGIATVKTRPTLLYSPAVLEGFYKDVREMYGESVTQSDLMRLMAAIHPHPKYIPRLYQMDLWWPVFVSLVGGLAESHVQQWPRQTGKTESSSQFAATLAACLPTVLSHVAPRFKDGISIGVYAPTQDNADKLTFEIRKCLSSPFVTDVLNVWFDRRQGKRFHLSNGSVVTSCTASEQAKLRTGGTHDLLLIDESHYIDEYTIKNKLRPTLAAKQGTAVYLCSADDDIKAHGYVYDLIRKHGEGKATTERIQILNIETVFNTPGTQAYRSYVLGEIAKAPLGINDPAIQSHYFGIWDTEMLPIFVKLVDLRECRHSPEWLERCGDPCTAGIDVARDVDRTVLDIMRIDRNEFEKPRIMSWYMYAGTDYPTQAMDIVRILGNFNIVYGYCDAHSVGRVLLDFMRKDPKALEDQDHSIHKIMPWTTSSADLTFDTWEALRIATVRQHYEYPDISEGSEGMLVALFEKDMGGMIKKVLNNRVKIDHPNRKGAFSDFSDARRLNWWAYLKVRGIYGGGNYDVRSSTKVKEYSTHSRSGSVRYTRKR